MGWFWSMWDKIVCLLAIKNVYRQSDGLDILLIDDPLQTIYV